MGTVNLKTASGGSVILSPANTASDVTITVPAANATMAVNGPAFSAYQSATQTIGNAVATKLLFQTKEFDTNTCYDTTLSRFTPTTAGYYQITIAFSPPSASRTGEVQLYIYKNGTLAKSGFDQVASSTIMAQTSALIYCNGTTDYIEAFVYLATGGATVPSQTYTYFQAAMVRSA